MGEENFFSSVSSLWKTFLEAALYPDAGEIVCVLDALDECQADERKELINSINEFFKTKKSRQLKFFLTSRPYLDIIS